LAGTGDKGRIYSISSPNHWELLQNTGDGSQVAALLPDTSGSKACFCRGEPSGKTLPARFFAGGKRHLHVQSFGRETKSLWGRLHPDGAKLEFSTRSGNTEKPEKNLERLVGPETVGRRNRRHQSLGAVFAVSCPI